MKKLLLLFFTVALISCDKDSNTYKAPDAPIAVSELVFTASSNTSLDQDVVLQYDGESTFYGTAPLGADMENLVATISMNHSNGEILLNGELYENASATADFSKEVALKVNSADQSSSGEYKVRLSYYTGIPILNINTAGVPIDSKEEYVVGFITLYGGLDFEDIEQTGMKIKGRGNSTWWQGVTYGKKPYQIKFGEDTGVLGMLPDVKWVLLAEYSDKSLMRNKITRDFGHMSDLEYTPSGEYVEVFLNGVPQGTYFMGQKVEVTPNRVNIGPEGYLIEIDQLDRLDPDDVYFRPEIFTSIYTNNVFNIKDPGLDFDTEPYNLVRDHINAFETALFGPDFMDAELGYRAYIDVSSFVDWYLINEMSKTQDARDYSSIYFTWVPGGKIKMGPLWDYDLSYGNVNYSDAEFPEGYWIKDNAWFTRMFEDPFFAEAVKTRFAYYHNNLNALLAKIDGYHTYIDASQTINYEIWGTLGEYVWPNPVYFNTYPEEVNHLKQWLTTRMNWMDAQYNQ